MRYSHFRWFIVVASLPFLVGCGRNLAGTYSADIRLAAGKTESTAKGYSLAEVKQKLQSTYRRELTLNGDGTYSEKFAGRTNRGDWTRSGDVLRLNDTDSNGVAILPALQKAKEYRLVDGGREIVTDEYSAYGLELVFTKK
jgi:hypothetical protein